MRSWTKSFQKGWQNSHASLSFSCSRSLLSTSPLGFSRSVIIIQFLSVGWLLVMYTEEQTRVWSQRRPETGMRGLAYIQYHNSSPSLRLEPSIFFPSSYADPNRFPHYPLYPRGASEAKERSERKLYQCQLKSQFCFKWTAWGDKKKLEPHTSDINFGKSKSMCRVNFMGHAL